MCDPLAASDLYLFRWIDRIRIHPTAPLVAYQVGWADPESREARSRIWIRGLDPDSEAVELTKGERSDHSPRWSPTGEQIAFISRVSGRDQLFVQDRWGGDARQLTTLADGASQPRWSPDGSQIAFLGSVLSDPDAVVEDVRPPEREDDPRRPPVARVVRRLDYRHDGGGYVDGRYPHLFIIPARGGEPRQLTYGSWGVTSFDWSPDGQRLVVAGNPSRDADLNVESQLSVVELDGSCRRLVAGLSLDYPAWSPCGDLIAFCAPLQNDGGRHERLWVVPAAGGDPSCLTESYDFSLGNGVVSDMRSSHAARLEWDGTGRSIRFLATGPGRLGLHEVDLDGPARQLVGGEREIFDFDVAGETSVFLAADPASPGDLHLWRDGIETRLTNLNGWLSERYVAVPERIQSTAPDGLCLEGWLYKPPGFDPTRRYPLVLQIHGGPHGQYGWTFFHEFQILAGMGLLVLAINPRGSDGYGEEFRRAVIRDWGGKDYLDLLAALDQLIERGFVDSERLGVAGGSYGGYMTLWMIGQTDRFRAAVAMRSICNLVSEYAQHDIVPWGQNELGPPPWPDSEELWRRSPIRFVKQIRTPLLLTHGEQDLRCAISQAEEIFGALRLLGREVEMIRFPGESHDLSRSGRPDRRVVRLELIASWFRDHLLTPEVQPLAEFASTERNDLRR